jgi:PTS system galactitol-specific IIC component
MPVLQYIVDLGASVMLPIIIFIIGLILKRGVGKSLQAGLTIGVGFVGISLVISLLTNNLGAAAERMAVNFHLNLSVVDVGWPGASPMVWASSLGLLSIPIAIGVNILMLVTRATRVVNVDIWNVWHMAFTGVIVQLATGNYWFGIAGVAVHAAIAYKLGDMFAPVTDEFFGLEGVAIPHGTSAYMGVFAKPIDDLIEKIPKVRNITITTTKLEEKLGVMGTPIVIGAILGIVIGALGYDAEAGIGDNVGAALILGVQMAAVMSLMPMVVKLIMQGLLPIAEAARTILQKRFKGDYRIGLDPALLLGNPQVISASLLFVPLTIVIAVIVPGNTVLPFGDLATIGFFIAMAVGIHKGNLFRTLFSGGLIMAITIWIANNMVPLTTKLAETTGNLGAATSIAALDQGGSPITYLLARGVTADVGVGFFVILALYAGAFAYTYRSYRKTRRLAATAADDPATTA